jgi:quercetin dioxygenase-like cupin family protein
MTVPAILFDLDHEIEQFKHDYSSGRYAKTLLKTTQLRIVLIGMEAGVELKEHSAHGPITIQSIRGRFVATVGADEYPLEPGTVLSIEGEVRHTVRAETEGVFLLTIVQPGDAAHAIADEQ